MDEYTKRKILSKLRGNLIGNYFDFKDGEDFGTLIYKKFNGDIVLNIQGYALLPIEKFCIIKEIAEQKSESKDSDSRKECFWCGRKTVKVFGLS